MKKIVTSIISLLILMISFNCYALNDQAYRFYVHDGANILSEETEYYIINNSDKLNLATKAQIVVITVDSLNNRNIEEYATDLFRLYKIGDKELNNGLLILIDTETRQCRIEVGYGLEEVLTDGLTGRYQDEFMIPYFKKNDWDNGIKNGYNAFYNKICEYYNIESNLDVTTNSTNLQNNNFNIKKIGDKEILFIIIATFFGLIHPIINKNSAKSKNEEALKYNKIKSILIGLNVLTLIIAYFLNVLVIHFVCELIVFIIVVFWINFSLPSSSNNDSFDPNSLGRDNSSSSGGGFPGGGGSSGGGGSTRGF